MPRDTPSEFLLERHAFFWMTQVVGRRDRQLALHLKSFGLRVPEWRALASLFSRHRCSMSELADLTEIERTTLSRTVDRMGDAGWVTRLQDAKDMRVTRLRLTAKGEQMFERVWPTVRQLNEVAVSGLPEPLTELLRWTLARMAENLETDLATEAGERVA